jgi:hypothetical protein
MPNLLSHASANKPENARRLALKQMAGLFGLSLSAQALSALANKSMQPSPQLLTANQLLITAAIAELIIPATDTAGALAVNVHGFIDQYLAECLSKHEQRLFVASLQKINAVATSLFNRIFLAISPAQQVQLLHALEKTEQGFSAEDKIFFTLFKSLTLMGYYTSEIGATQELAYLAIPGGYKGDFPFAKIGKAWALN